MGQTECNCFNNSSKPERTIEEHIDAEQLQYKLQQARAIKTNFSINSICHSAQYNLNNKPSSSSLNPTSPSIHQSWSTLPDKQSSKPNSASFSSIFTTLVFNKISTSSRSRLHNTQPAVIKVDKSTPVGTVMQVGSELAVLAPLRVEAQEQEDRFLLSVKYTGEGKGGVAQFYMKDQGVGLGCFYRLQSNARVELRNNLLVNIGSQFLVAQIRNQDYETTEDHPHEPLTPRNKSSKIPNMEIKIYGNGCSEGSVCFTLDQSQTCRIGRNPNTCNIVINDDTLADTQCQIVSEGCKWYLYNTGVSRISGGGVWVHLNYSTRVEDGMIVRCGRDQYNLAVRQHL